ncbi:hypothetical protein SEA_KINGMUSTIK0402_34 [Mycobacterium phage Kingmustik0402]|uniref:Uncharacterized protein n=1 Tax=Mycobacterium phage Kingmustik0402 TaxID=2502419 RepID=A0A411BQL0_9CAUD|nr:hypothetical protein SEA_KINGMUSTIK0402_34 [Mycobacterium phage Kingmustik0402]
MAAITIAMAPWGLAWATFPATDTSEPTMSNVQAYHCVRRARVAVVATMMPPSTTRGTIHACDTPLSAESSLSAVNDNAKAKPPTATVPAVATLTGDSICTGEGSFLIDFQCVGFCQQFL